MGLLVAALFALFAWTLPTKAHAEEWEHKDWGHPSITANSSGDSSGVSVVLPAPALTGDVTAYTKHFLEEFGPRMCSDVFNFNEPHKGMHVEVSVIDAVVPGIPIYEVSPKGTVVTFDYEPQTIKCVSPEVPTS